MSLLRAELLVVRLLQMTIHAQVPVQPYPTGGGLMPLNFISPLRRAARHIFVRLLNVTALSLCWGSISLSRALSDPDHFEGLTHLRRDHSQGKGE